MAQLTLTQSRMTFTAKPSWLSSVLINYTQQSLFHSQPHQHQNTGTRAAENSALEFSLFHAAPIASGAPRGTARQPARFSHHQGGAHLGYHGAPGREGCAGRAVHSPASLLRASGPLQCPSRVLFNSRTCFPRSASRQLEPQVDPNQALCVPSDLTPGRPHWPGGPSSPGTGPPDATLAAPHPEAGSSLVSHR